MTTDILQQLDKELDFFSNKNGLNKAEFKLSINHLLTSDKKLASSSPNSIKSAIMTAAALGLIPNNHTDQCIIYSEYGLAKFYLQYKGLIKLMYDTMGVVHLDSNIINDNDDFSYEVGTTPTLSHIIKLADPGEPIGVYAMVKLSSGQTFAELVPIKKINEIKAMSKSRFWTGKNDPNNWMEKKTAIKQLAKLLPPSNSMSLALKQDDLSEGGVAVYIEKDEIVKAKPNESAISRQKQQADTILQETIKAIGK